MPNPSLVRRHKGLARHSLHQMLNVDVVRFAVAWSRFTWYARVRRQLRTLEHGEAVATNTVSHNLRGLRDLAVVRSLYLIRPLSVLEDLGPEAELLVIGPRAEGELLALLAHGFNKAGIHAVDLISYSPWIDLGDMHRLPYRDGSFDAVIAGWVLAYSDDKRRAAEEILRVVRPGGFVAIGVEWSPHSNEEVRSEIGYVPGSEERLTSVEEILELFGDRVEEVLVRHDVEQDCRDTRSLVVIFRAGK
jgi:SAM-dependent methyltransferase